MLNPILRLEGGEAEASLGKVKRSFASPQVPNKMVLV